MLNRCSPALRAVALCGVVGGILPAAGGVSAQSPPANSPAFQIEIPEAKVAATTQANIDLDVDASSVQLIVIHVLSPDADNIDYGQLFCKVNGAAASRISETRPAVNGKVMRISLHNRPGFELLPENNTIEVQATEANGKALSATFNVHTPGGACRGGGRARILELGSLADLIHAGVTMNRLIQLVVDCGVNFIPSADTDEKLKDLGAEPKLLAAIHNPAAPEFRPYQSGAVQLDQLLGLLQNHVAEDRIIANVEDHGVGFPFTPDVEAKLRDAGASQKLIQSVRYMAGGKASEAEDQALSVSQIMHLLQGGDVAKNRLFDLVQQRGVNFRLDRTTEDKLRAAGANEKLMRAIRDASDRYATTH